MVSFEFSRATWHPLTLKLLSFFLPSFNYWNILGTGGVWTHVSQSKIRILCQAATCMWLKQMGYFYSFEANLLVYQLMDWPRSTQFTAWTIQHLLFITKIIKNCDGAAKAEKTASLWLVASVPFFWGEMNQKPQVQILFSKFLLWVLFCPVFIVNLFANVTILSIGHEQKGGNHLPKVAVRWCHMFSVMSQWRSFLSSFCV